MTKREPLLNIGVVCEVHASKPGAFTGRDPKEFIGKYIKLGFTSKGGPVEHMWVKVNKLDENGKELHGTLNNDPVLDVGYECGDDLVFEVHEIEAVDE